MAQSKVSSAHAAQLVFLDALPPKLDRIHRLIEEIAVLRGTDTGLKALTRMLDELRNGAAVLSLTTLADTFGMMGAVARRGGGGHQMKIRALREGLVSLKTNLEGSRRAALKEEPQGAAESGDAT